MRVIKFLLIFSIIILLFSSCLNLKTKPNEYKQSYLEDKAVIHNKKVPYYGFEDPIEKKIKTQKEKEEYSHSIEVFRENNITYYVKEYLDGWEIVDVMGDFFYYSQEIDTTKQIKSIKIPESYKDKKVIKLGGTFEFCETAFYNFYSCLNFNYKLKDIYISSTIKEIVKGTFDENKDKLERIRVDKNNPYYSSKDGILYNKKGTIKLCVPKNHHSKA